MFNTSVTPSPKCYENEASIPPSSAPTQKTPSPATPPLPSLEAEPPQLKSPPTFTSNPSPHTLNSVGTFLIVMRQKRLSHASQRRHGQRFRNRGRRRPRRRVRGLRRGWEVGLRMGCFRDSGGMGVGWDLWEVVAVRWGIWRLRGRSTLIFWIRFFNCNYDL